mmetsp:Transcript_21963/g.58009  ORF Transcript_21963/g.58009 Transcript_21963/m.58009 type:complete len:238 (+) Transcript_21963:581-1294(+)
MGLLRLDHLLVRGRQLHALRSRDEVLKLGHDGPDLRRHAVLHEVGVPLRHQAEQLRPHLAVRGHREAREAARLAQLVELCQRRRREDALGLHDEAALVLLHQQHLLDLLLDQEVRVDDAKAALQRHGDRHLVLRDGVHGAGHDGRAQRDLFRELRVELNLVHAEGDLAGHADEVIVGIPRHGLAGEDVLRAVAVEVGLRRAPRRAAALDPLGLHRRGAGGSHARSLDGHVCRAKLAF